MLDFDFPLSPKARTYLKFEAIFKRCELNQELQSVSDTLCLVRAIVDYIDLVDGSGSLKIEVIKDLEKNDAKLREWLTDPEADTDFLNELRERISKASRELDLFSRQRTKLQVDPIIECVKPRFLTPCGVNPFDTPLFEYWLHQDLEERQYCVKKWLHEMDCLRVPICTVLDLWRLCADHQKRVAKMGFMQEVADSCDLINIRYEKSVRGYPVVSGFQSRVNIRFMPYEKGAPVGDIDFEIAYIKGSQL
ncbi:MAG: cell division protein ZapD [Succinivibrio sp.]|nr:cell division protein ZapD [Succinivibrio sp.]